MHITKREVIKAVGDTSMSRGYTRCRAMSKWSLGAFENKVICTHKMMSHMHVGRAGPDPESESTPC